MDKKFSHLDTKLRGELGSFAERYASEYLELKGYKIIFKNYRKPWGEIDIVAEKENVIVFVEVKANRGEILGFEPELRVSREKRYRMARIARTFLSDKKYSLDQAWQMDILAVTILKDKSKVKLRHYKNID